MAVDKNLTSKTLSQGDRSDKAATGLGTVVEVSAVGLQQPAAWKPGQTGTTGFGKMSLYLQPDGRDATAVLEPLVPADQAYQLFRLSPLLSTIIEAFSVNVYGVEYTFEPIVDLDDPDSRLQVRAALEALEAGDDLDASVVISDEAVAAEVDRIRSRIRREREFLTAWFSNACDDPSYHAIRILLGQDKGIMGTGYWEVVRGATGIPKRLVWVPSFSVRALPQDAEWVVAKGPGKKTSLHWHNEEEHWRHFRQYVQLGGDKKVVARYKEFGDPRVLSRGSGRYYRSVEEMQAAEQRTVPKGDGTEEVINPVAATEILAFKTYYSGSQAYGMPKWTPVGAELIGLRDLSEHNRLVVTDQSIPNMVLLVSGAKVDQEVIDSIKEQLKARDPSEPQILVLQAYDSRVAPTGPSITPTMKLEKTKEAQTTDALGLKYTAQGWKGIRQCWRLPKVALGDDDGTNRSTAFAMARFTEDQVWDPERCDFDDRLNTTLLPALNIQYLKYRTLSRAPRDPELLSMMIERLARAGVLSPDESREIAAQIFNKKFKDINAIWTKLPLTVLNAILQTKNKVTASAIMLGEQGETDDTDILASLREAILRDFESEGISLESNVQGSNSDDNGSGESGERGGSVP